MTQAHEQWKVYRTRFLVKALRLDQPITIADGAGSLRSGAPGDYLVETASGTRHIAPRAVFEELYQELEAASSNPSYPSPRAGSEPAEAACIIQDIGDGS